VIEVPARMAHLPRDARGYPVPVVVKRDESGRPLFIVNDAEVIQRCIKRKLCSICGARMVREFWFAGGPGSAFDPRGMYLDPPMHHECLTFALQTCPYLASPVRRAYVDAAAVEKLAARVGGGDKLLLDPTVDEERPDPFVAVMSYGVSVRGGSLGKERYLVPLRPYHAVEFWRHGERLSFGDGLAAIAKIRGLDLSALRLMRAEEFKR